MFISGLTLLAEGSMICYTILKLLRMHQKMKHLKTTVEIMKSNLVVRPVHYLMCSVVSGLDLMLIMCGIAFMMLVIGQFDTCMRRNAKVSRNVNFKV